MRSSAGTTIVLNSQHKRHEFWFLATKNTTAKYFNSKLAFSHFQKVSYCPGINTFFKALAWDQLLLELNLFCLLFSRHKNVFIPNLCQH